MSELLLELFSEEIPARLQTRAAEDLRRLMVDGLKARGLEVGEARAFATPRRLALVIEGVPKKSPAVSEEKKGPRVGAPEQAIAGFLKGAGLASLDEAQIVKDEKKGDFYVARIDKPGRAAAEIVNEVLREAILNFPWPKTMRFNAKLDNGAELRWIRPLHSIVLLLDGKVVPFEIAGVKAGKETRGHRFLGNEPFKVTGFAEYEKALKQHKVVLDSATRTASINEGAHALAKEAHLTLVEDDGARRRERRPHRVADRADGRVRQVVSGRAGRVPDDGDADAPEVLFGAPRQEAVEPLFAGHQPEGQGRRQDHRRRQREGHRARACPTPSSSGSRISRRSSRSCATS